MKIEQIVKILDVIETSDRQWAENTGVGYIQETSERIKSIYDTKGVILSVAECEKIWSLVSDDLYCQTFMDDQEFTTDEIVDMTTDYVILAVIKCMVGKELAKAETGIVEVTDSDDGEFNTVIRYL